MTAATLNFLSRITNEVFETQMQRAARKICERQHYFGGHSAYRDSLARDGRGRSIASLFRNLRAPSV